MNFKAGDKIKMIRGCSGANMGDILVLKYGTNLGGQRHELFGWKNGVSYCSHSNYWKLVGKAKKEKSKTEKQKIEEGANIYKNSISTRIEIDIKREEENITARQRRIKEYKEELKRLEIKSTETEMASKYGCDCADCRKRRERNPQAEINYQRKMILKNRRNLNSHKSILENALSLKSIRKDIERVKKHPSIIGIEYQPGRTIFSIYTKPLRVLNDQQSIGHYIINIWVNSRDLGHTTIYNQIKRVEGSYDHWLVENGHVCFGTWEEGIKKYLKMGQFYLTVDSLIKLLIVPQIVGGYFHTDTWLKLFNDTPLAPEPTPSAPMSTMPTATGVIEEMRRINRERETIRSGVTARTIRLTKPEDLPF